MSSFVYIALSTLVAMINELPSCCVDQATENVAVAGVGDTFIALLILLYGESERNRRGCFNFGARSRRIDEAMGMGMEDDILK